MKQSKLLWLAAVGLTVAGCSNDELMDIPAQNPKALSFDNVRVQSNNPTTSRAEDVLTENLLEFAVWANYTKAGETTSTPVFKNQRVSRTDANSAWSYSPTQYWTIATYNFYALAPLEAIPTDFDIANMSLDYTNAGDQDLVYAQNVGLSVDSEAYGAISLTFKHMLTRLRFQLRNRFSDGSTIQVKSIEIDNAVKSATLGLGETATWTDYADNLTLQFIDVDEKGVTVPVSVISEETATDKVYSLYHYIIPTLETERTYNVNFEIIRANGDIEGQKVAITKTFEAGKSYNIITDIKDKAIYFDGIEVENWGDWQSDEDEDPETPVEPEDLPEGSLNVLSEADATVVLNEEKTTWDEATTTLTFEGEGNAAVAFDVDAVLTAENAALTDYDSLVLELAEASTADVQLGLSYGGYWGTQYYATLAAPSNNAPVAKPGRSDDGLTLTIPFEGLKITLGDNAGKDLDLAAVKAIILKTAEYVGTEGQVIKVKNLYLAKAEDNPYTPDDPTEVKTENLLSSAPEAVWQNEYISWDAATNTISVDFGLNTDGSDNSGNAAMGWSYDPVKDISTYKNLVLELAEASTAVVELAICTGGFWGDKAQAYIEAGSTQVVMPLTGLVLTEGDNKGSEADLTAVNLIMIRSGWVNTQTIKIKSLYLTTGDASDTPSDPVTPEDPVTPDDPAEETTESLLSTDPVAVWQEDCITWANNTITVDMGTTTDDEGNTIDASGNAAMGWNYDPVLDISDYKSLTLELAEASDAAVELAICTGGFWGDKAQAYIEAGSTSVTIPLSGLVLTEGNNKGSVADLTSVNLIMIRSGWVHTQTIKVKDLYLTK